MKKIAIILGVFAFIASSCGQKTEKQTETEDTLQISMDTPPVERQNILEDIRNIPFSKADIAVPSDNGIYGKFSLNQKWTTVSPSRNQIIVAETKYHYYDFIENLNTSFVEQGKELDFRFNIAFKGVYSEKDIEILPLTPENDVDIINLIRQNMPIDIAEKEFWKKHTPDYKQYPFEITDIQPYSFTNNENKIWIAYCKFRFEDYEEEYTGLVGVTANKEVVLLSGYCVYEYEPAYLLRFRGKFLLYVINDTCGEGAIVTTRLYKLTAIFEKIFDETVVYD
ncbi:MAG: hypothetical protein FWH36_06215 [Lentimicrobiaceae bacterium]|nr:hypothetical protein [Lentimicrobiaceae bacterium]